MTNWWLECSTHTWTWCTSVLHLWLRHNPALSISKFTGLSPRFGVTTFTSNTVFFQHETAADLRSGNDAIIEINALKVSKWCPLRCRLFGPSAEEGVRVRHVKMRRRQTSSARERFTVISTAVSARIYLNLATSLRRRTTRWISSIDRKGQSSYSNVKMSLNIQATLAGVGGWDRPSEGIETVAVSSVQLLSPPSTEPERAKSKQIKSTRHRKLSLLKSERLQDFTVLPGTTQNTVK